MKIIRQLFWIFLFTLLGEGVSLLISNYITIPGSIIGMILFFLFLHFEFLSLEKVDQVSSWLISHMGLFFVPVGVGLMVNYSLLVNYWFELTVILVLTLTVLMIFLGKSVDQLINRKEEFDGND